MQDRDNLHATAIVLGDRGVLIRGDSGSGKTSLALALIRHCHGAGMFARLVSDDQIYLSASNGRLTAHAPETIAGLAEVRGLGPRPVRFERNAVIDLVVELVEAERARRFDDDERDQLMGVQVPRLVLPERNETVSLHAVLVAASERSFG